MIRRVLVFAGAMLVVCALAMGAEQGVGAGAFLRRGVDARALAMGGAHAAVVANFSSLYWNPAGIARAPRTAQVGGMFTDIYGAEIYHNYLAGLYRWDMTLLGDQPLPLGVGGAYTEVSTEVRAYDDQGNPLGIIRYSERLIGGGMAMSVPGLGYAGVVLKAYSFLAPTAGVDGGDASAFGIGLDMGISVPVWKGLQLGVVASDLGDSRVRWRNTPTEPTDRVSARYALGAAYTWQNLVVAADFSSHPGLDRHVFHFGVEYNILFAALRVGLQYPLDGRPSLSAGAGVSALNLHLDAAWVQNVEIDAEGAGATLVASASFRF